MIHLGTVSLSGLSWLCSLLLWLGFVSWFSVSVESFKCLRQVFMGSVLVYIRFNRVFSCIGNALFTYSVKLEVNVWSACLKVHGLMLWWGLSLGCEVWFCFRLSLSIVLLRHPTILSAWSSCSFNSRFHGSHCMYIIDSGVSSWVTVVQVLIHYQVIYSAFNPRMRISIIDELCDLEPLWIQSICWNYLSPAFCGFFQILWKWVNSECIQLDFFIRGASLHSPY